MLRGLDLAVAGMVALGCAPQETTETRTPVAVRLESAESCRWDDHFRADLREDGLAVLVYEDRICERRLTEKRRVRVDKKMHPNTGIFVLEAGLTSVGLVIYGVGRASDDLDADVAGGLLMLSAGIATLEDSSDFDQETSYRQESNELARTVGITATRPVPEMDVSFEPDRRERIRSTTDENGRAFLPIETELWAKSNGALVGWLRVGEHERRVRLTRQVSR